MADGSPIFVSGCPRSGTTFLGAVLGGHPDVVCVPESQFIIDIIRSWKKGRQRGMGERPCDWLLTDGPINSWRLRLWGVSDHLFEWDFPRRASGPNGVINRLVDCYALSQGRQRARTWVDHTPSHIRFAPMLLEHFPEAVFIHIVRDGRAVANSVLKLPWGPNTMLRAAHWWMAMVAFGLIAEYRYGPERVIRVKYEDLVQEPSASIEEVCSFVGLEVEDDMLKAAGFDVPIHSAQQHELIGKPPDDSRAGAWKADLNDRQIEIFEAEAAFGLESLGYQLTYDWCAIPADGGERLFQGLYESVTSLILNPVRNRLRRRSLLART